MAPSHRFGWLRLAGVAGLACWALVPLVPMPIVSCPCDHAEAETLASRVCSLCGTAERHTDEIYFLKDIQPSQTQSLPGVAQVALEWIPVHHPFA